MNAARRLRHAAAVVAFGALVAGACEKKDSLVVVSLTASPQDTSLTSVSITVGGVTKPFALLAGLSATAVTYGVYVGQDVTGTGVPVSASARRGSQSGCYEGSTTVTIATAGSTVPASLVLTSSMACDGTTGAAGNGAAGSQGSAGMGAGGTAVAGSSGTAGAGGMAGTSGTAGTGGAGGAGPLHVVSPPTLTKCTEYFHTDVLSCNNMSISYPVYIADVAFSPDGTLLATAGSDGNVKLWKMVAGVPTQPRTVVGFQQTYVSFSPDGTMLVVGSENGALTLFKVADLSVIGNLLGHDVAVEGVGFTGDGQHIWSIDYAGILTRHDVGAGVAAATSIPTGKKGYALGVSPVLTATQEWLAVGYTDGTGDLVNALPGTTATPIPINVSSDSFAVDSMTFSPNGLTMAAGGSDGVISFWSVPPPASSLPMSVTITIPDSTNTPMTVNSIRYSSDTEWLAIGVGDSADEYKLAIFDAQSRKVHATKLPSFAPLSVAWSPQNDILVAGEDTCGKFIVCSDDY